MKIGSLLKYERLIVLIVVSSAFILSFTIKPSITVILLISLLPILLLKFFVYRFFYQKLSNGDVVVFGVNRKKIVLSIASTLLVSILVGILIYSDVFPEINRTTRLSDWIFLSIILWRFIESFVPISYWSAYIESNMFYRKSIFAKPFELTPNMTIRRITDQKSVIELGKWKQEIWMNPSETSRLETIIANIKSA